MSQPLRGIEAVPEEIFRLVARGCLAFQGEAVLMRPIDRLTLIYLTLIYPLSFRTTR